MQERSKTQNVIHWILGIVLCALGISLCTKADFGLSMISAPPYIIHVRLSDMLPWYTQGTSEYIWQAVILLITCLVVRRFKVRYLLSFVTALISGFTIDGWLWLLGGNGPYENLAARIFAFVFGAAITSLAIAFVFRTSMPPQIYELAVKEIADRYDLDNNKVKLANDIVMLVITAVLAWLLTRSFTGIGIGTIIITFVNAPMIAGFGKLIDKIEGRDKD